MLHIAAINDSPESKHITYHFPIPLDAPVIRQTLSPSASLTALSADMAKFLKRTECLLMGVLLATKASVHDTRARIFVRYVMAFMINILNVFRTVLLFASDA